MDKNSIVTQNMTTSQNIPRNVSLFANKLIRIPYFLKINFSYPFVLWNQKNSGFSNIWFLVLAFLVYFSTTKPPTLHFANSHSKLNTTLGGQQILLHLTHPSNKEQDCACPYLATKKSKRGHSNFPIYSIPPLQIFDMEELIPECIYHDSSKKMLLPTLKHTFLCS